jgi:hypothetical protein
MLSPSDSFIPFRKTPAAVLLAAALAAVGSTQGNAAAPSPDEAAAVAAGYKGPAALAAGAPLELEPLVPDVDEGPAAEQRDESAVRATTDEAAPEEDPGELDATLARVVSKALGALLEAPVEIKELRRYPDENRLRLEGVQIGNPSETYESPHALLFEHVHVKADPRKLLSRKGVIEMIDVGSVQVNAETTLRGQSNLKQLMESAKRFGDRPRLRKRKKWIIESLKIAGGEVEADSPFLGGEARRFDFSPVDMALTGNDRSGMTLPEAAAQVLARIAEQAGMRSPIEGVSIPQLVDLLD